MTSAENDIIYYFDASALIDLQRYYDIPEIWDELDALFSDNRILSHRIVFEELTTKAKEQGPLSRWVSARRASFKTMTAGQAVYVASIVAEFPGLIDPSQVKDQADPWLIALALEERARLPLINQSENLVVVSQENPRSSTKIPAVCKHFGVRHMDLGEFFESVGWELKLHKK